MLITKILETSINVDDPIDFIANKERHILNALKLYENHCYKGVYIIRIIKIIKASKCYMIKTNLDGNYNIDVQFEVEAEVYGKWDVLAGVDILGKNQVQYGKIRNSNVIVNIIPTEDPIHEKQTIPIRVIMAYYGYLQPNVTLTGILLTCVKNTPVFSIKGKIITKNYKPLITAIKNEIEIRDTLPTKKVQFFEDLLTSYPKTIPLPKGAHAVDIISLFSKPEITINGIWTRDLTLYHSSSFVAKADSPIKPWNKPINENPDVVFRIFLVDILNYLILIKDMCNIYTNEMIENHKNIWTTMRNAQLPLPSYILDNTQE